MASSFAATSGDHAHKKEAVAEESNRGGFWRAGEF